MPPRRSTPKILHRAGELRKQVTPAEQKLWAHLRLLREEGVHFRRQHAIGQFITDFCAPRRKLVIELDGPPFGRNIWNKETMILKGPGFSNQRVFVFCASGTMK